MNNLVQRIFDTILGQHKGEIKLPDFLVETMDRGLMIADVQSEPGLSEDLKSLIKVVRRAVRTKSLSSEDLTGLIKQMPRDIISDDVDLESELPQGWLLQLLLGESGEGKAFSWLREQYNVESAKHLSGFFVTKGLDGQPRWFGWVTNRWEDRDKEILTDAAHRDFLAFLDAHPDQAPELWSWHTAGTARKNRADFWDYVNGFFLYSGPLTEAEAAPYLTGKFKGQRIGMSHGFYVIDRRGRFITKYRTFEVSELPHDVAANPFTDFQVKEEQMAELFSDRKRAFLVERYGEDHVSRLETETENRQKILEEMGVDWKEVSAEYEAELEKAFAEQVAKATEPAVKEVVGQVIEALNVEGLQAALKQLHDEVQAVKAIEEKVVALQESVAHLLESEDARIAKALAPKAPVEWNLSVQKTAKPNDKAETIVKRAATTSTDWLANLSPFGGN